MSNLEMTYGTAKNLTKNTYQRTGYEFIGWSTDKNAKTPEYQDEQNVNNLSAVDGGTVTLYAVWSTNNYTLTVDPNGGKWNNTTDTTEVNGDYGTTINIQNPEPPTGYTVSFNPDGGDNLESITATNTFTGWTKEGEGTLDGNNSYTYGEGNGKITANYDYGTITLPSTEKDGYEIDEWYDEDGNPVGKPGEEYKPEKDETLTPHWKANKYTIVFDANGGSGNMANMSMTYDTPSNLTRNAFTKAGYVFVGWNTDKNATSAQYVDGQSVNNLTTQNGGTVTIYAIWKRTITITYDANGGTGAPSSQTGTLYNSQASVDIKLSDDRPSKEGFSFNGWATSKESSTAEYQPGNTYPFSDSVTLYAIWGTNSYELTVNPNGGRWNGSKDTSLVNGDYGTTAVIADPEPPAGYTVTFDGNGGTAGQTTITSTKRFSNWTVEGPGTLDGTVYTFGAGNGSLKANYKDNAITLPEAKKDGYTVDGWYNEDGERVGGENDQYTPTGDETLHVEWKANTYTIVFNNNGGTGSMSNMSMTYDTPKNLTSNAFTRAGYNFFGWSTDKDATTQTYTNGQSVNNLTIENGGTVTLYALWRKTITVTYNADGGSGAPTVSTGTMYNAQTSVEITLSTTKPTKSGYTFNGWTATQGSTQVDYQPGGTYSFSNNTTIYAVWGVNNYTLTVKPNGGKWNNTTNDSTVPGDYGTTTTIADPIPPAGYTITLNANTGNVTPASVTSTKSFDKWTKSGAGTFSGTTYTFGAGDGTLIASYTNNEVTLPTPTKTGYHCTGWYTASSGGTKRADAGGKYTPTASETLFAQWAANTYTVVFNNNGGSGTMSNQTMTYGTATKLTTNAFTKTGYKFVGWNTDQNETTAQYTDGQSVTNLTDVNGGSVTLYAIWRKDITITYNVNGGTGTITASTGTLYNSQSSVNIKLSSSKPTREGHTFLGWSTSDTATSATYQPNTEYPFSNNTTLYAVWSINTYTLTINPNGGEYNGTAENTTVKGQYNSTITIANPTPPPGYTVTFNGNGGSSASSTLTSTKSFDKWEVTGNGTLSGTKYTFYAENVYYY